MKRGANPFLPMDQLLKEEAPAPVDPEMEEAERKKLVDEKRREKLQYKVKLRMSAAFEKKTIPWSSVFVVAMGLLALLSHAYFNHVIRRSYNRDPRKLVASTPGHYDPLEGGESMRHTYTLTKLPEDTKGKFMEVVEHCPPYTLAYYYDKSCSTSAAIYPNEDRTLKVLIGSLTTVINGTEAVHTKGATVEVPRGTALAYWNTDVDNTLEVRHTVTPPLPHAVAFYQNLAGLQRDGLNSPWQMVTLLTESGILMADHSAMWQSIIHHVMHPIFVYGFNVQPHWYEYTSEMSSRK